MANPTDRELVDQARSGNSAAFGALVRRHQRRIFRLAFHIVRSGAEAEDVTQETFVRAYQAIGRFDGRSEPFTWLYRIAVNLSLNSIRSRKSMKDSTPTDDPRSHARDSFSVLNLRLAVLQGRYEYAVFVNNLLDKDTVMYRSFQNFAPGTASELTVQPPRIVGASIKASF